ncbi:MAG TPA: RNase adapter RapZ [Marinobacterium sp.]|nr:RNase adapter RapZ [Marinobacterium sp.]
MRLVVISGRSGSGKTTALQALEDVGFYCIDNLPASLLPTLVEQMNVNSSGTRKLAVGIDARNLYVDLVRFQEVVVRLRESQGLSFEIVFLDASEESLLKRYSATRRKHPLSTSEVVLEQAIELERQLLEPIASEADLQIDTTSLSLYQLRDTIKERVAQRAEQALALLFESFGFKHGVPLDVDFSFDVRILPNPYWHQELRQYTGQDQPVIDFLSAEPEVERMIADIRNFIENWIPGFKKNNRSYVTVGIGCTGGQHRSVFIAEQLAGYFKDVMDNVQVRHRELT